MIDGNPLLGTDWDECLGEEFEKQYWLDLQAFVDKERSSGRVYPPQDEVHAAFQLTKLGKTKAVILGQDPYHGPGQAHGLAFSVRRGVGKPPALRIIHKELHRDRGLQIPDHGSLEAWACRGVLLLNATLTVREGKPGSHRRKGWEKFTDAAIRCLNAKAHRVVFLLWGEDAREKCGLIDTLRHTIICSSHPSPRSAYRGSRPFFESAPFSRANRALRAAGREEINWDLTKECTS